MKIQNTQNKSTPINENWEEATPDSLTTVALEHLPVSQENSSAKALTTFHRFMELPYELQMGILARLGLRSDIPTLHENFRNFNNEAPFSPNEMIQAVKTDNREKIYHLLQNAHLCYSSESLENLWIWLRNEGALADFKKNTPLALRFERNFDKLPTKTGLEVALYFGFSDCLSGLLKRVAKPSCFERLLRFVAFHGSHPDTLSLLLADPRFNPAADDNYAIQWASRDGRTEVVELLLADTRVNPAADDNLAIRFASEKGHKEVVELLLTDARVNPAARDNTAIQWASEKGRAEVVKLLLADSRVDPTAHDDIANGSLRWASQNGHTEVVKLLLADSRVDPAARDNLAIRQASRNGHKEVVKLLLADARVNPAANGNVALQWASRMGHTEVVKLLLADARVNPAANHGLHFLDL